MFNKYTHIYIAIYVNLNYVDKKIENIICSDTLNYFMYDRSSNNNYKECVESMKYYDINSITLQI